VRSRSGTLGLALFFAVAVVPVVLSLLYALLYSLGIAGLLGGGPTLAPWIAVLSRGETWASFGLSLWVAAAACSHRRHLNHRRRRRRRQAPTAT